METSLGTSQAPIVISDDEDGAAVPPSTRPRVAPTGPRSTYSQGSLRQVDYCAGGSTKGQGLMDGQEIESLTAGVPLESMRVRQKSGASKKRSLESRLQDYNPLLDYESSSKRRRDHEHTFVAEPIHSYSTSDPASTTPFGPQDHCPDEYQSRSSFLSDPKYPSGSSRTIAASARNNPSHTAEPSSANPCLHEWSSCSVPTDPSHAHVASEKYMYTHHSDGSLERSFTAEDSGDVDRRDDKWGRGRYTDGHALNNSYQSQGADRYRYGVDREFILRGRPSYYEPERDHSACIDSLNNGRVGRTSQRWSSRASPSSVSFGGLEQPRARQEISDDLSPPRIFLRQFSERSSSATRDPSAHISVDVKTSATDKLVKASKTQPSLIGLPVDDLKNKRGVYHTRSADFLPLESAARTLVMENIPRKYRTVAFLQSWASTFGVLESTGINHTSGKGIVTFRTAADAQRAYSSPCISGNEGRHGVRVWWYRQPDQNPRAMSVYGDERQVEEGEIDEQEAFPPPPPLPYIRPSLRPPQRSEVPKVSKKAKRRARQAHLREAIERNTVPIFTGPMANVGLDSGPWMVPSKLPPSGSSHEPLGLPFKAIMLDNDPPPHLASLSTPSHNVRDISSPSLKAPSAGLVKDIRLDGMSTLSPPETKNNSPESMVIDNDLDSIASSREGSPVGRPARSPVPPVPPPQQETEDGYPPERVKAVATSPSVTISSRSKNLHHIEPLTIPVVKSASIIPPMASTPAELPYAAASAQESFANPASLTDTRRSWHSAALEIAPGVPPQSARSYISSTTNDVTPSKATEFLPPLRIAAQPRIPIPLPQKPEPLVKSSPKKAKKKKKKASSTLTLEASVPVGSSQSHWPPDAASAGDLGHLLDPEVVYNGKLHATRAAEARELAESPSTSYSPLRGESSSSDRIVLSPAGSPTPPPAPYVRALPPPAPYTPILLTPSVENLTVENNLRRLLLGARKSRMEGRQAETFNSAVTQVDRLSVCPERLLSSLWNQQQLGLRGNQSDVDRVVMSRQSGDVLAFVSDQHPTPTPALSPMALVDVTMTVVEGPDTAEPPLEQPDSRPTTLIPDEAMASLDEALTISSEYSETMVLPAIVSPTINSDSFDDLATSFLAQTFRDLQAASPATSVLSSTKPSTPVPLDISASSASSAATSSIEALKVTSGMAPFNVPAPPVLAAGQPSSQSSLSRPVAPLPRRAASSVLTSSARMSPAEVSALAAKQKRLELYISESKQLMTKLSTMKEKSERDAIMARLRLLRRTMDGDLATKPSAAAPVVTTRQFVWPTTTPDEMVIDLDESDEE